MARARVVLVIIKNNRPDVVVKNRTGYKFYVSLYVIPYGIQGISLNMHWFNVNWSLCSLRQSRQLKREYWKKSEQHRALDDHTIMKLPESADQPKRQLAASTSTLISVSSLGWVSPGVATEDVTPIFLEKKLATFL